MKKKIINCWIIIIILVLIILYGYLIWNVSNIWKRIKCPTYPVDEEYEWVIKAEYNSLVLIDWTYSHIDFDKVYDWCYWDAWLDENKLVCPNWYNSWAWIKDKWEFILDMEEDSCYDADSDESMLKAIYDEKHRED